MIGVFLTSMSVMEGVKPQEKLKRTYWDALKANWTLWPMVQAGNLWLVPLQYRVLVVNVVNIGMFTPFFLSFFFFLGWDCWGWEFPLGRGN